MYNAHLCSEVQYNTVELLYYKHLILQLLHFAILLFYSEYRSILCYLWGLELRACTISQLLHFAI